MKARRILIVQLGRVGDLILMSPMVRELKRANAGHEIHLLGSPYNVELARHYPYFDTVHLFRRNPFQLARLIIALRREAFDVWMDVKDHFSKLGSLMALTSNAKSKIGYNARLEVFNHAILPDSAQRDVHAVDRYLKTLSHFDIDIRHASRRPAVFVDKDSEQRFEGFCERRQLFGYCCVNVSAASKHRYWHVKKWNELFAFLSDRGKPIVIISAPNDRYFANGLAGRYSNAFYFETASITDVFPVVEHAETMISLDTAIVHVGSAFNTPMVALFGNFEVNCTKFRPLSDHYRVVVPQNPGENIPEIEASQVTADYGALLEELGEG